MFGTLKRLPWEKIGSIAVTAIGATLTAIAQRRNQEIVIEKVGARMAKEILERQQENNF